MLSDAMAQTHLFEAFSVFGYIFGAAIAGLLIGFGTLLASIGSRPIYRAIILIGILPGFGILGLYLLVGWIGSAANALAATAAIMAVIALATFYWPEKPTHREQVRRPNPKIDSTKPPRL